MNDVTSPCRFAFWRSRALGVSLAIGLGSFGVGLPLDPGLAQSGYGNYSPPAPAVPTPAPAEPPAAIEGNSVEPEAIVNGVTLRGRITELETEWQTAFSEHFQRPEQADPIAPDDVAKNLARLSTETNHRYGLVYIFPGETTVEIILVTSEGSLHRHIQPVTAAELRNTVSNLQRRVARPSAISPLEPAQQLYDWLIRPIAAELEAADVDTLVFCVGEGVRSLPFAALHNGERFLVEDYSMALIPAFSLTDPTHERMQSINVLAMGASEFQDLGRLPAVPTELQAISGELQNSQTFLNEGFTVANLQQAIQGRELDIIHLATHAVFSSGDPSQSFIQFWDDEQVSLADLPQLGWGQRGIELLVLSACQTAVGDPDAELGFAGMAYQSGVKSAIASLWSVSDTGTLQLMTEFYHQLAQGEVTTKAEALRAAQLALLQGTSTTDSSLGDRGGNEAAIATQPTETDFSHPFYWAAFTLVGSPW